MMKVGDFLAQSRKAAALSQKEVAEKLGYSTSQFISNWERNLCMPPIPKLRDLAELFGIAEQTLFNMVLEQELTVVAQQLHQKLFQDQQTQIELPQIELKHQSKQD